MESHSGQKWSRLFYSPVLPQISPDAFPASQMQVHPSRIDDDQLKTRFHMAKNNDRARNFHRSRIEIVGGREFFTGREFFISREFFSRRENTLISRHFRAKMFSRGTNKDGVQ